MGKVVATENGNKIYADEMTSHFEDVDGKTQIKSWNFQMSKMFQDAVVTSDRGEYL